MNTYCKFSASHKCENEAGLKHFIKHGEIHGCAGCCKFCLNKDTCEYRCVYVKGALTPAQEAKPSTPAFDFSPLGDLAGAAADADQQFDLHYGTAQDEYLVSCIYLARIHALTAKAGRYGGGTWTKWYESKGMSKSGAWNMVQTGESFNGSTIEQLKCLPALTRKDLNLIARSGCADQVVAAAGDSQRVQDLLAQIKSKDAQLEAAHADISGLKDRATAAEAREEEAWQMQSKAEARAREAEKQLEGSRQVAQAAQLRGDKLKAENDALKSQPITAVVDKEEVRRQAQEMAASMTADLQAQLDRTAADTQQDARDAYDSILMASRSILNSWQTAKFAFRKLPQEQLEAAAQHLIRTLGQIQGEVAQCL